jgi:hypothetical protein
MIKKSIEFGVETLSQRALPNGGFSGRTGGGYRPDATAWAILALVAMGSRENLVQLARSQLGADQMQDGRVSLSPDYPEAFWPTPLAVIAWQGSLAHRVPQLSAVKFLLDTTGKHWVKRDDSVFGHDTSIRGWPWIGDTHSWVEPTAMVLLALELTGYSDHERAREARLMLLDRQLESGGWNYGNTSVFGQQLRPMPEPTGLALNALSGRVQREIVERSIYYLKDQVGRLRTPHSLGWSLLGLGAWGEQPADAESFVFECIDRQHVYGSYDTQQLSLLLASLLGKKGLLDLVATGSLQNGRPKKA